MIPEFTHCSVWVCIFYLLTGRHLQEAIADADSFGIMGIAPDSELTGNDAAGQPATATASELRARNVSDLWLRQYLSQQQLASLARLSLFAASFDAAGAAAVLHGADAGPVQRREAAVLLRCLRGLSVLQETWEGAADSQPPRYSMHLLVRGLAAGVQRQQLEHIQLAAVTGFLHYVLSVSGKLAGLDPAKANATARGYRLFDLEMPNMVAVLHLLAAPDPPDTEPLFAGDSESAARRRDGLDGMGRALSKWGQPRLAMEAARTAYEVRSSRPDEEATLMSAINLSVTLSHAGLKQEAVDVARHACAEHERVLGPEDSATLRSLSILSTFLAGLDQHEEAREVVSRAFEAQERVLGPDHPDTLSSLGRLSSVLFKVGRHEEALAKGRQALAAQERVLGRDNRDTLCTVSSVSMILTFMRQHREAVDMALRAFSTQQDVLGPEHPATLTSQINLSVNHVILGHISVREGADRVQQALIVQMRVLGLDHPATSVTRSILRELSALLPHPEQREAADTAEQALQ